jgi:DHA2 family multidrug resistance protein
MMIRQATMLSYKNAFAILAVIVFLLSPLPFLMRLPTKRQTPLPEDVSLH